MKFKTDENLHPEVAQWLRGAGHEAVTVWDQSLQGIEDERLAAVCRGEGRALLTLDSDFADIRRYRPHQHAGIIVLRLGFQCRRHVLSVVQRVEPLLGTLPLQGRLWIADETSVRVREGECDPS